MPDELNDLPNISEENKNEIFGEIIKNKEYLVENILKNENFGDNIENENKNIYDYSPITEDFNRSEINDSNLNTGKVVNSKNRSNICLWLNKNMIFFIKFLEIELEKNNNGFVKKYIKKPIDLVVSFFCNKNFKKSVENKIFGKLPNLVNDIKIFGRDIKSRIGILILYNEKDLNFVTGFLEKIIELDYLCEIMVNL